MSKEIDRYTYRVIWSEDDSEHVGLCAEFPSLSWLDKSPEKALKGIRQLVRDANRDIGAELLQAMRDVKAGNLGAVYQVDEKG